MNDQILFYQSKLLYEIDSWDLSMMIKNSERVVVLDVRAKNSYDEEHIEGAINLPHREITQETTASYDKDILFVTYCDGIGCNGSTKGALKMASLGFNVKELIGGIDWWKRDGHATSKNGPGNKKAACGC